MKERRLRTVHRTAAVALAGLACVPVWQFLKLCNALGGVRLTQVSTTSIVPFFALTVTVLACHLLTPALDRMSPGAARLALSGVGAGLFVGLELLAEHLTAVYGATMGIMWYRMYIPPESRMEFFSIPPAVRMHYYIFSILLILLTVHFLYGLRGLLSRRGEGRARLVVLQGITTVCYALAYCLVRVMEYDNYAYRQITPGSVVNAALCFVLAALAAGLFVAGFCSFHGIGRFLPPMASLIATVGLYIAEYAMLGGTLYAYGEHALLRPLPLVGFSATHVLITLAPAVLVYLIHAFSSRAAEHRVPIRRRREWLRRS